MKEICSRGLWVCACLLAAVVSLVPVRGGAAEPILIGLDAAMSGPDGQSGEAIRRGLLIAIKEINESGGVLGRELGVVVRDNRGVPARGIDAVKEFAGNKGIVAIMGGIHSAVALAELKTIHELRVPYLGPWAAATSIVRNSYDPNYVFRLSARDEYAGELLVRQARQRGYKSLGLLLWRTGGGRSNEAAMKAAIKDRQLRLAGVRWLNTSQADMSEAIADLKKAGADAILLVANAGDGLTVIRNMADLAEEERLPIIGHWGMSGGDVFRKDPVSFGKVDYTFLQTYSFYAPTHRGKAEAFMKSYCELFSVCGSPAGIFSPVGSVHAYDLVHILKRAIERAGTIDRSKVRAAMERLNRYDGLVRVFNPPFTKDRHDALDVTDLRLARYGTNGSILPITPIAGSAALQPD